MASERYLFAVDQLFPSLRVLFGLGGQSSHMHRPTAKVL